MKIRKIRKVGAARHTDSYPFRTAGRGFSFRAVYVAVLATTHLRRCLCTKLSRSSSAVPKRPQPLTALLAGPHQRFPT